MKHLARIQLVKKSTEVIEDTGMQCDKRNVINRSIYRKRRQNLLTNHQKNTLVKTNKKTTDNHLKSNEGE